MCPAMALTEEDGLQDFDNVDKDVNWPKWTNNLQDKSSTVLPWSTSGVHKQYYTALWCTAGFIILCLETIKVTSLHNAGPLSKSTFFNTG